MDEVTGLDGVGACDWAGAEPDVARPSATTTSMLCFFMIKYDNWAENGEAAPRLGEREYCPCI